MNNGSPATLMISTEYARRINWCHFPSKYHCIELLSFLFNLIYGSTAFLLNTPLVSRLLEPFIDESEIKVEYKRCISFFIDHKILFSQPPESHFNVGKTLQKDITFFYSDKGEYYNLEPIAKEAEKRGYKTTFTNQLEEKAEIGFYCQHVCHPENSRFSAILLHDMAQGHNRWPNLWEVERWNIFDIGIMPGKDWSDRWTSCANQYYTNPRFGVFEFGYPKSDLAASEEIHQRAAKLQEKFKMKYDFTVLYAPSWENDNYDNVYYIDPEENIMTAISMCDLIVSDESSVMTEGALFHKPALAVCDWLIPDTTPSRFASVPMDYVLKCIKVELREQVYKLSTDLAYYDKACSLIHKNFSNSGNVNSSIMDTIDYYTGNSTDTAFMKYRLSSKYRICSMWN